MWANDRTESVKLLGALYTLLCALLSPSERNSCRRFASAIGAQPSAEYCLKADLSRLHPELVARPSSNAISASAERIHSTASSLAAVILIVAHLSQQQMYGVVGLPFDLTVQYVGYFFLRRPMRTLLLSNWIYHEGVRVLSPSISTSVQSTTIR